MDEDLRNCHHLRSIRFFRSVFVHLYGFPLRRRRRRRRKNLCICHDVHGGVTALGHRHGDGLAYHEALALATHDEAGNGDRRAPHGR